MNKLRKITKLLNMCVEDLDEIRTKLEAVIDDEPLMRDNENACDEAEQAEQEIVEAKRKILHASDTLRQIYNECYDD